MKSIESADGRYRDRDDFVASIEAAGVHFKRLAELAFFSLQLRCDVM